jgi:hypothetical protein
MDFPFLPIFALLIFVGLIGYSTKYVDYQYLGWTFKVRIIEGRDLRCIDLPEEYWRRIPKCAAPERDRKEPSNLGSFEEESA